MKVRTRGWVVKNIDDHNPYYWRDADSNVALGRTDARVFLTRFEAFAARDEVCSASCCTVFRLTRRKVPK